MKVLYNSHLCLFLIIHIFSFSSIHSPSLLQCCPPPLHLKSPYTSRPLLTVSRSLPVCVDVPAPEQPELFLKKLQQCCTVFDFMDTLSDLKMKEYKRSTLNELVDYVTVSRGYLTEQAYPEVVKMVRPQRIVP